MERQRTERKKTEIFGSWDLHKSRSKYMAKVIAVFRKNFNQPGSVFPVMQSRLWEVYGQEEVRASEAGLFPGNLAAYSLARGGGPPRG